MLITKIQRQKKDNSRYSIFIDNKFCFGLDEIDLINFKLKENLEIDEKMYEYIIENVLFNKAKHQVAKYLTYKMYSESQIRKKLTEKEFPQETIEKVISLFKKYKYIDDYKFAKHFLTDRLTLKKYGLSKIIYDLSSLGVNKEIIDKIVFENNIDELEIAIELLKKKNFKRNIQNLDYKEKQKLLGYLARRGFSYDIAKKALQNFLEEVSYD